jgi:hypothetical protein
MYPCDDPLAQAVGNNDFPRRSPQPPNFKRSNLSMNNGKLLAPRHVGDDLLNPLYATNNAVGVLQTG